MSPLFRVCPQDMELLAENRSLVHAGKLLRQPDTCFGWCGWSQLFVLLFDNYCKSRGLVWRFRLLIAVAYSGHDKTKGEGWYHEVQRYLPSVHSFPFLCTFPN
jgi:hypothetical protein